MPLASWVPVASGSDFPIQNLPFGVFTRPDEDKPRVGVRIGDFVLDLKHLEHAGLFRDTHLADDHVFCKGSLNRFMSKGRPVWRSIRRLIGELLLHPDCAPSNDVAHSDPCRASPLLRENPSLRQAALLPVDRTRMVLPIDVAGFVDFYASKHHATNVGVMFRGPDNALMPNWVHLPVAYNGRAGSVVVSGTDFHRPHGQSKPDDAELPTFGPSRMLDFELEIGFIIGVPSTLGSPVPVSRAIDHVFGLVLLNDWSARDIQKWEYQPLGPFLGKSFATSISPWVVMLEALEPFRVPQPLQEPPVLPYLQAASHSAFDIHVEALLQTPSMTQPASISRANFRDLYWSIPQMIAHMTVNGCNLNVGDLCGSGTISGPTEDSRGSLLELAWKGARPLTLPNGEKRASLQDGDTLILRGHCERSGPANGPGGHLDAGPGCRTDANRTSPVRIGFGECRGTVLPAVPP